MSLTPHQRACLELDLLFNEIWLVRALCDLYGVRPTHLVVSCSNYYDKVTIRGHGKVTIRGHGKVTIDWGDGEMYSHRDRGLIDALHVYKNQGRYNIMIHGMVSLDMSYSMVLTHIVQYGDELCHSFCYGAHNLISIPDVITHGMCNAVYNCCDKLPLSVRKTIHYKPHSHKYK
jgi:hypothetical protein